MKTICVFCSSSNKAAKPYFDAARELGSLIAESGFALLYGGTDIGLAGDGDAPSHARQDLLRDAET